MSLPNLKFSDRDDDGLGPLRPDLLDLSDIEESDDEGDLLNDLQTQCQITGRIHRR